MIRTSAPLSRRADDRLPPPIPEPMIATSVSRTSGGSVMICDCGGAVDADIFETPLGREDCSVAVDTPNTVQPRLAPDRAGAAWCAVRPVRRAHTMQQ